MRVLKGLQLGLVRKKCRRVRKLSLVRKFFATHLTKIANLTWFSNHAQLFHMTQPVARDKGQTSPPGDCHHGGWSQTSDLSSNLSFEQVSTILTHSFLFILIILREP